jgi:hypothetical protein
MPAYRDNADIGRSQLSAQRWLRDPLRRTSCDTLNANRTLHLFDLISLFFYVVLVAVTIVHRGEFCSAPVSRRGGRCFRSFRSGQYQSCGSSRTADGLGETETSPLVSARRPHPIPACRIVAVTSPPAFIVNLSSR